MSSLAQQRQSIHFSSMNPMLSMPATSISTQPPVLVQIQELVFDCPGSGPLRLGDRVLRPGITLVRGDDEHGLSKLLRLLAGTQQPLAGQVQWLGDSIPLPASALDGWLFWIDPADRSQDEVTVGAYWQQLSRRYPRWNWQLLDELQAELGLTPHLDKSLYMLSTGSRRKVALAAAFAAGAALTLLDRPFAALDLPSRRCVTRCLQACASQTERIHVVADYEAPENVPLSQVIDLNS